MRTERKKSDASAFLEKLTGGPLTFRRVLRATRLGDEMTQAEFSARLGITKQHLSDIENGRKVVSPERAYKWAKKLGYMELQWAELALQDTLDKAHMRVRVHLEKAA